jgi:hypothetical protein
MMSEKIEYIERNRVFCPIGPFAFHQDCSVRVATVDKMVPWQQGLGVQGRMDGLYHVVIRCGRWGQGNRIINFQQ